MKLVVDAAHGAAYQIAPMVFHELGAAVVAIGCAPDGLNINHEVGATHPQALRSNLEQRLRAPGQFLPQGLACQLELDAGTPHLESDGRVFYLKPSRTTPARLKAVLSHAEQDPKRLFACVKSLDQAEPVVQQQVAAWLDQVIGRMPFDT